MYVYLYASLQMPSNCSFECVCLAFYRVPVKDREVKVNIFDMAGHPIFYEVSSRMHRHSLFACY